MRPARGGKRGIGRAAEQRHRRATAYRGHVRRTGVVAHSVRRAARQRGDLPVSGSPAQIHGRGRGGGDLGDGLALGRAADDDRRDAARVQRPRQRGVTRRRPALFGMARGTAGYRQREPGRQPEPRDVAVEPRQIRRRNACNPRRGELPGMAIERVQGGAARIGVGMRTPASGARPLGTRAPRKQPKITRRAARSLKIVHAREPRRGEAAAKCQKRGRAQPARPDIFPHFVEPAAARAELRVSGPGEQGDSRARVARADGGERAGRQRPVAERAELDDQNAIRSAHGLRRHNVTQRYARGARRARVRRRGGPARFPPAGRENSRPPAGYRR